MKKTLLTASLIAAGLVGALGAAPAFAATGTACGWNADGSPSDETCPTPTPSTSKSIAFTDTTAKNYRTLVGTDRQLRVSNTLAAPSADSFGAVVELPEVGTSGQVKLKNGQCLATLFDGLKTVSTGCTDAAAGMRFEVVASPVDGAVLLKQGDKVLTATKTNKDIGLTLETYQPTSKTVLQNVVPNK